MANSLRSRSATVAALTLAGICKALETMGRAGTVEERHLLEASRVGVCVLKLGDTRVRTQEV